MPGKILAADDDSAILKLLEVTLRRAGYEVITAADGREALAKARAETPDLLLLDVMMPHLDGFEALAQLRADPAIAGIPVIVLTAKRHDADLIHGIEAGAVSYLTKPFNPTELISLVQTVMEEGKPADGT
jgi:DNA-binding response OmpR family regulator